MTHSEVLYTLQLHLPQFSKNKLTAGYLKNWPNFGISTVKRIKKYLKFVIHLKILTCEPKYAYFGASHARILRLKKL